MLLLPHLMRLSTDIDIIVDPGTDVKEYILRSGNRNSTFCWTSFMKRTIILS